MNNSGVFWIAAVFLMGCPGVAYPGTIIRDELFRPGTWSVVIGGGSNVSSANIQQIVGGNSPGNAQRTNVSGVGTVH